MVVAVPAELGDRGRPGSHQGHISLQDIEELGELVQRGLADEFSHPGNAGIVLHLEHEAIHLVLLHESRLPGLRIDIHGTELVDFEESAVLSHSFLGEKYRTRGIQLDGNTQNYIEKHRDGSAHQPAQHVHETLQRRITKLGLGLVEADHGKLSPEIGKVTAYRGGIVVLAEGEPPVQRLHHRQIHMHGDAHLDKLLHGRGDGFVVAFREEKHLIHRMLLGPGDKFSAARHQRDMVDFAGIFPGLPEAFLIQQRNAHQLPGPVLLQKIRPGRRPLPGADQQHEARIMGAVVVVNHQVLGRPEQPRQKDEVDQQGHGEEVA